jgi:TonB family protein
MATAMAQAEREGDGRQRSIEDVRRVFDANKGAIFAIYNRALRQDPTLQGKVVLRLVIDPTGRVAGVEVVTSELEDDGLVAKIVNRVRMFDFGQRDVGTTTISYPVHFLPT